MSNTTAAIVYICCSIIAFAFFCFKFLPNDPYWDMEVSPAVEFRMIELYKNGDKDIKNKIKLLNSDGIITNKEFSDLKSYIEKIDTKNKLDAQKKILKELINE